MYMRDSIGKTGNAPIVKVGQTFTGINGSEPMAVAKGAQANKPTEQTFK